jgi:hypothetical protein
MDYPLDKLPIPKYKEIVHKKKAVQKINLVKYIDQLFGNDFIQKYNK